MAAGVPRGFTEQQFKEIVAGIDTYVRENPTDWQYSFDEKEIKAMVTGEIVVDRVLFNRLEALYKKARPAWDEVSWEGEAQSAQDGFGTSWQHTSATFYLRP